MASWRDSDDPRCPACGGKITATASYCMHCDADFADDGSVVDPGSTTGDDEVGQPYSDVDQVGTGMNDPDDVGQAYSDTDEVGQPIQDEDEVGQSYSDTDQVGQPIQDEDEVGQSYSDTDQVGESMTASQQSSGSVSTSGVLGSIQAAMQTGSVKTGDVEPTSLLLRGPVSVFMGFPVAVLLTFVLGVVGDLPGGVTGWLFLLSWGLGTVFLLQRPLASDAIGDAFYLYALVMIVGPLLWLLRGVVMLAIGANVDMTSTIIGVVALEMGMIFPVVFLVLLGYGCNYYARSRIESALGEGQ